jgi:putative glutamine amidotransferase
MKKGAEMRPFPFSLEDAMPVIGITTYTTQNAAGNPIAAVAEHYIRAVLAAGGTPVLLPNALAEAPGWEALYDRLDGVLLTGGGDIDPLLYDAGTHPKVNGVDASRDSLELALAKRLLETDKPFLGVCRGLQVLNVALGGTLHTHIPEQVQTEIRHDCYPDLPRNHLAHPVRVEEDSRVAKIFAEPILQVNSLHHQGIRDLAPGLKAVAFAPDGLVEAVELPQHAFGFAVQWHPEWLTDQASARRLFQFFVQAAAGQ